MLRYLLALALCLAAIPQLAAQQIGGDRTGAALEAFVRTNFRPTTPRPYDQARQRMFGQIDNRNGKVRCVYTGVEIATMGIPNSNTMNTEHTWPQGMFNERAPMRADLHHLFPTLTRVNGERDNHPFGEVPDSTAKWWRSSQSQSQRPAASVIDEFSESTPTRFEPREDHKGNVARAMLYFWVVYRNDNIQPQFMNSQLGTLLAWHEADPVNDAERARNTAIKAVQGNDNPFVLDPTLASRIVQSDESASDVPPAALVQQAPAPTAVAPCYCVWRFRWRRCR